jgi:uncharacterized protein (TIRG00374 family)
LYLKCYEPGFWRIILTKDLQRKLAIGIGLGIIVIVSLLLYGDVKKINHLLVNFQWSLLPAIVGLSLFNYLLRGLRFHYYLLQIGIRNIRFWTSLRVFVGGFSLMLTPGQVGEFIRLLWLKNLTGAEPARTAPSILVDRVVDGLVMAVLASIGALIYPKIWPVVALFLAVLLAAVVILQNRPLAMWVLEISDRLPVFKKFTKQFYTLYDSTFELLRVKNLLIGLGIGFVAWTAEGVAVYLILVGLGAPTSGTLLLSAVFTLAISALLGGFSGLPAGVGAAELSLTGVLRTVVRLPGAMAATATLMIRFFTLWLAVITGTLTVLIWRNMLFTSTADVVDVQAAEAPGLIDSGLAYEKVYADS